MKLGNALIYTTLGIAVVGCANTPGDTAKLNPTAKGQIPKNSVAMGKEEMADKQGIPLYPGAVAPEGQSTMTEGAGETRYSLILVTPDPVKKVVDFYSKSLPGSNVMTSGASSDIMVETPKHTLAQIKIGPKGNKTTIEAVAIVEKVTKTP